MKIQTHCTYTELRDLNKFNINPDNDNDHKEEHVDLLVEFMKERGIRHPIIVSSRNDIMQAGHLRLLAAKKLGLEKYPVDVQEFKDEKDEYLFLSGDNNVARYAEFNSGKFLDKLKSLEIDALDFDFKHAGLLDFELPDIEVLDPQCDEDSVPEIPVDPITKRGDVWLLDSHRVMCGDSIMIDDVEKLMNGEKADMVFTSPPYNGDTHLDYGKGLNKKLYENNTDKWTSEEYIEFCRSILGNIFSSTNGFIFWNVSYNAKSRHEYIKSIYPYIENLWETIIWKKTGMPISEGLTRNTEFIFCFKNNSLKRHVGKKFTTDFTLWEISNIGSQHKSHKACYPIALPEKGITLASEKNNIILDPFNGTGSTLIACEKTKRKCYGMELDKKYCDVIVKRWQEYTGKEATLESNGVKFNDA